MIVILYPFWTNNVIGDKHIKQDAGAFTEGAATSTTQLSEPPVPAIFFCEPKESGPPSNKESGTNKTNLNTNDLKSGVCHLSCIIFSYS